MIDGPFVQGYNAAGERKLYIGYDGSGEFAGNVKCNTLNGYVPVTKGNIGEQYVAHAESSGDANIAMSASYLNMSVTANDAYLTPLSDAYTGCGSSYRRWSAVFAASGTIVTSDQNKKNTIQDPDERYLKLAKMIIPKSFKMNEGTSGRTHLGFIAQEVEAAMTACGISDIEFAGLVKAPIYAKKLTDEDGNELPEYDTASEITGYDYALRYDEFIPLLLARIISQEERIRALEEKAGQ